LTARKHDLVITRGLLGKIRRMLSAGFKRQRISEETDVSIRTIDVIARGKSCPTGWRRRRAEPTEVEVAARDALTMKQNGVGEVRCSYCNHEKPDHVAVLRSTGERVPMCDECIMVALTSGPRWRVLPDWEAWQHLRRLREHNLSHQQVGPKEALAAERCTETDTYGGPANESRESF